MTTQQQQDLGFLLDDFRDRTPGVVLAVGVSSDGIRVAATSGLPDDRADQLAAIGSGLVSLLAGMSRCLDAGPVKSNLTEFGDGFALAMSHDIGSSLVVLVGNAADIGHASHEMGLLIERVGPALTPSARGLALGASEAENIGQPTAAAAVSTASA